jgi:ribosome modulation factor
VHDLHDITNRNNAFVQGRRAANSGAVVEENPYPVTSGYRKDWLNGFETAKREPNA